MPSSVWDDVIGHETVVRLLKIWADQPGFSYLFHGPSHLGKNFLAEKFIRSIIKADEKQDLRLHPDVVSFLPEEGKKEISVEQVRNQRARLYERPQISERMVGYLPKLDRLNETGLNALLKIMEEPPAGTVFVSVAENVNRIPTTILSRTIMVPMGLVPIANIQVALERRGAEPAEAHRLAVSSRGRPGLAVNPRQEAGTYSDAAERYAAGPRIGDRIAAADELRRICESDEDTANAWSEAIEACIDAIRQRMVGTGRESLILAQGVTDAGNAINGPIQPHIFLDAAALQAGQGKLNLPGLYPKYFPLSLKT